MFSGIIERQGKLVKRGRQGKHLTLTIEAKLWDKPLKRGESMSVDGVCLTVAGKPKGKCFVVKMSYVVKILFL